MTPLTPSEQARLLMTAWRALLAFAASELATDGWQGRYGVNESGRVLFVRVTRAGQKLRLEADTLPALVALLLPICPRLAWMIQPASAQPRLAALPPKEGPP